MPGQTPDRYLSYAITTPAGTAIASPVSTPLNCDGDLILTAEIRIPPGHVGLTGIQLVDSGGVILPFGNPGTFITGDGYDQTFNLNVQAGTRMFFQTYNLGNYAHTHYILLHNTDMPRKLAGAADTSALIGLQG